MTHQPDTRWALVFGAWLIATLATLGALFMSEIMGFAPCVLCWWQRIFMFPLVLILALGLFPFDPKVVRYALPLALPSACWWPAFMSCSRWASFLKRLAPCRQGIPCKTIQIEWFGFVTIPLLSFLAFLTLNGLLLASAIRSSK